MSDNDVIKYLMIFEENTLLLGDNLIDNMFGAINKSFRDDLVDGVTKAYGLELSNGSRVLKFCD